MKAWIFSDLHLEIDRGFSFPAVPDADICLCAGDILDGGVTKTLRYLSENVAPYMSVIFVPGNHEYYRSSIRESLKEAFDEASMTENLFILDGGYVILDGYRFIGATLWTNFNIQNDPRTAMFVAREKLNDYKRIKLSKIPYKKFTPQQSQGLHFESLLRIDSIYDTQPNYPTVVVSHHAPSILSVPPHFIDDALTPAFASHLESRILKYQPLLWVHGHIHSPSDYHIGRTRVICNPLGYPDEPSRKTFVPGMVIDIAEIAHA